jgi:uncharacterized protein (DUF2132 family)
MDFEESFLTKRDHEDFDTKGRRVNRRLIERYPDTRSENVDLLGALLSTVRRQQQRGGYWFEAACIQVRQGDGMTWSAEAARHGLARAFPEFRVCTLSDETTPDKLPAIGRLIGDDLLLKAAVKVKLTRPFISLNSRHGFINFAIVVVVAALTQIFSMLLKKSGEVESAFLTPSLYLALGGYALLAAITQVVLAARFFKRDDAIARLIGNLQDENRARTVDTLADALAGRMSRATSPRFVIVDGFGRIDEFSRQVIEAYFDRHTSNHSASEMWIVFESDDDVVLGAMVPRRNGNGAYGSTRLYDQEMLSEEERTRLATFVNAPERAAFATVSLICRFAGGETDWIEASFREYVKRTGEPKRNALTYFYFLALEQPDVSSGRRNRALGGHLFFPWPWLEMISAGEARESTVQVQSLAAQKKTAPAKVVAQFFGGPLRVEDVNVFSAEIQREFSRFIVYNNERTKARFHVSREAAEWLVDHERELKLPPAPIGKLFWALALSNARPNDASWTRRAIRDLLEVDLGLLGEDVRAELYPQVRDLFIRLIDASVRRSRFSDVPELIEAAVNAVIEFEPDKAAPLAILKEKGWEVYLISGSDAALRALLTIGNSLGETAEHFQSTRFLHIFSQACPLTPASRALLEAQLAEAGGLVLEVARDHAVAMAIWLSVTGAPFLYTKSLASGAHLLFDLAGVMEILEETIDRVAARLASSKTTHVLDIATITTAAWSLALLLHDDLPWFSKPGDVFPDEIREARLADVVAYAEKAVIAAGLYTGTSRKTGTVNFLGEAMIHDACAAALATAWLARAFQRRWTKNPEIPIGASEARLIKSINEILEIDVVAKAGDGDASVIEYAERLLVASAMTWQRFGLERLSNLTSIRRLTFSFRARRIVAEDYDVHRPIVEPMSPILREADINGLLSNLTLAHCFADSAGMLSYYVASAAELAAQVDFGDELRITLALIAVLNSSPGVVARTERLVSELLADGGAGSALQAYLNSVPDEELRTPVLELNGYRNMASLKEVADGLESAIRRRAEEATSEDVRNELLDFLAITVLRREIESKKTDPAAILEEWASRRGTWIYPGVLRLLLDVPSGADLVRSEAKSLLGRRANLDVNNAWYLLAIRLTYDCAAHDLSVDVPIRYLRDAIGQWERRGPEELNVETYRLLARFDASAYRLEHQQRLRHWQSIIIERDHLQFLPELAKARQFFLIFRDYVEHMWHWGLKINVPDAEFFRRKNLPMGERQSQAAEWKKRGAQVPHAVIANNGNVVVDAEYVFTGTLLFSPPVEKDDDFHQDRLRFDEEARRTLPTLIDQIQTLEAVPLPIRRLIRQYANEFL